VSSEESDQYGALLTGTAWTGWPLRVGSYPGQGCQEGLVAAEDTIVVWSGGRSDVTLHARSPGPGTSNATAYSFERHGGMIDFLPKGTVFDSVRWRGQPSQSVSVTLARQQIERLFGRDAPELDPERGFRLCVSDPHLLDLVRRLESQAVHPEPWGALYVDGLSLTLASYVYGRYVAGPPSPPQGRLRMSEVERLVGYVDSRLSTNIALTELAGLLGYSESQLVRLFKSSFGVSPYQYVLQRRVERAKSLLTDGRHSLAEIALACGFATQSHFSASFKARIGLTPGAYRRG
jgi:AraC family transcriptional regulator